MGIPLIRFKYTPIKKRTFCSALTVKNILAPLAQLPQFKKDIFTEYIQVEQEAKYIKYPTKEFLIRQAVWRECIERNEQLTEAKKRLLHHTTSGICIEQCLEAMKSMKKNT